MTQPVARVLVIDNDPQVGMDLLEMLDPQVYAVRVVQGEGQRIMEQAQTLAQEFCPHVVVVDLRLLDEFSDDRSGFSLVQGLCSSRCIVYSAYLTPEVQRNALKEHGVIECISKGESPLRLLDAIENASRECCARLSELHIHLPPAWPSARIAQALFPGAADLSPDLVEDLLKQLFPETGQLALEWIGGDIVTSQEVSRGRSVVMKVQPDDLEPVIVKLSPIQSMQNEHAKYKEHVENRLVGRFYARLERTVTCWNLGGAVYDFMGSSLRALPSFTSYYRQESEPNSITRPLRHFFCEVWSKHYSQAQPLGREPLFHTYDRSLRLGKRLQAFGHLEESQTLPGLPMPLINPMAWVLEHGQDSLAPLARGAVTHGDLHGNNLFVDAEHAWAIDFERTGEGHILRDFAELEVDIVTRIALPGLRDLAPFFTLAVVLADLADPAALSPSGAALEGNVQLLKALDVIQRLRELAHEATGCSDFQEYLWGLLFDAVFVASLTGKDNPQHNRALLMAAVLCERLQRWDSEWPPAKWPLETYRAQHNPASQP